MRAFCSGILFLYYTAIVRGVKDEQCVEKSNDWAGVKEYRLTCGKGELFYVDVIAGTGSCNARSACEGSTPYMIENQYNCFWRNQCSIRVPSIEYIDIIVRANGDCLAERPRYMRLSSPLCIDTSKPARIIDAVRNFEGKGTCGSLRDNTAGIIRSHSYYPWDYEGPTVFNENHSITKCFELYRINSGATNLIVTVRDLDLWPNDFVKLVSIGNKGEIEGTIHLNSSNTVGKTYPFRSYAVRVIFHVDINSKGGRGFLLCYANVDFQQENPDACKEISRPATIQTVEDSLMLPDTPRTNDKLTSQPAPMPAETCKDCKKRCRKVPKNERKVCRKSCKPLCKKGGKKTKRKNKKNKNKKGGKRKREAKPKEN